MQSNELRKMLSYLLKHKKYLLIGILSFTGGILTSSTSHVFEKIIDTAYFSHDNQVYKISDTTKYFPLEMGNKWTYEGIYKGTFPNSNKVYSKEVRFTTEVFKIHKFKEITVVLMREDISKFSEEISNPTEYAYVIVSNKIYSIHDSKIIEKIIKNEHAYGVLEEYKLAFEFPLSKGLKFGETTQIGRSDVGYIWNVEKVFNVKSHMAEKSSKAYFIAHRAVGWHKTILFQPFLGILEHSYKHNGTVDEFSFKLTSFITKSEIN